MSQTIKPFWNLKKTGNSAELVIYGEISDMVFWGDEVVPKDIDNELKAMGDVSEIIVRINSPGGNVFAGVAIHSMLVRHKATKTVYIDGIAASIASIIAMAGDKIIMANGTMMMIHNPMNIVWGNANEFRAMADRLDSVRDALLSIYTARTGMSDDEVIALLDAETWMSADEAVNHGFATEIEKGAKIAACMRDKTAIINGVTMEWSRFKNAPKLPPEDTFLKLKSETDSSPAFTVGTRVEVNIDPAHMEGQTVGEVREAVLTWVYGILFDGMEDMGIHKWYVESELASADEVSDKKNIPMKMLQEELPIVARGRNIDLEYKSLELYKN